LPHLEPRIGSEFERTETAGVRLQNSQVRAGVAPAQPSRGNAAIREQDSDALLRANAFAGSDDQIVAPSDPAGSDSAPAVHGHDASGGAIRRRRQFI
jgi:hypothetical protein